MANCYLLKIASRVLRSIRAERSFRSQYRAAAFAGCAALTVCGGTAFAAEPIPTEIDPYTLEPVGFHRYSPESYGSPVQQAAYRHVPRGRTTPRHPAIFADALKDAATGFYGGVEYLNLSIDNTSERVFGNYQNIPDFSDDSLDGYLRKFVSDDDIPFDAPEQPLLNVLTPGSGATIFPTTALTNQTSDGFGLSPDQFVPNPFFNYEDENLNTFDTTSVIDPTFTEDVFIADGDFLVVPGANLLAPSFQTTSFSNAQSIRGTVGYQFDNGIAIEASVFDLATQHEGIRIESDLGPRSAELPFLYRQDIVFVPVVVSDLTFDLPSDGLGLVEDLTLPTGLTSPDADGNVADLTNALLPLYFDGGFALNYEIDLNGAETNMLFSIPTANRDWSFDLMLGAKYLGVDEAMTPGLTVVAADGTTSVVTTSQRRPLFDAIDLDAGTFPNYQWDGRDDVLGADFQGGLPEIGEIRNTTIASDTDNNVYAAQLGLRTEYNMGWATLGVAPKLALGVNDASASVTTSQLFRATDPTITRNAEWSEFAAIFDVGVYARMQIREWLHARVGYQFMMADGISHAPDVIDFTAATTDPGLGIRETSDDLIVQGLTLGFEVLFP